MRTNGSGSRPSRAAGAAESAAGTSYCHQDQVAARPCRAARGCSARRSRRWRGGRSRWSRSAEVRPATVLSWPARMYSASATCWMIAAGEGQGSSTTSSASVLAIAESHSAGVSGCGRCLLSDSTRVGPFFSSSRRGGPGCEAAGGAEPLIVDRGRGVGVSRAPRSRVRRRGAGGGRRRSRPHGGGGVHLARRSRAPVLGSAPRWRRRDPRCGPGRGLVAAAAAVGRPRSRATYQQQRSG